MSPEEDIIEQINLPGGVIYALEKHETAKQTLSRVLCCACFVINHKCHIILRYQRYKATGPINHIEQSDR